MGNSKSKNNKSTAYAAKESLTAIGHYNRGINLLDLKTTIFYYTQQKLVYPNMTPKPTVAMQKYKYKYEAVAQSVVKYFGDDRFFYQLNIVDHKIGEEYLCFQDKYISDYVFAECNR